MSEPTAVAESVTSTDVSVTVDPAQLNKPVHQVLKTIFGSSEAQLGLANARKAGRKKDICNVSSMN